MSTVLWLSHLAPYPPKGGVLQRSYNLLREAARYHDIYLIAFIQTALIRSMYPDVQAGLDDIETALSRFCKDIKFMAIPCEHKKNGKAFLALKSLINMQPYTIEWLRSSSAKKLIKSRLREKRFDTVYFDTISLAPYLFQEYKFKAVLGHHNAESHMMLRRARKEINVFKKLYFYQEGKKLERYEKKTCRKFDVNITCSSLDARRLRELDPYLNIKEISNGVDIDYFSPMGLPEIDKRLVFAGSLDWYPNRDAMIYFASEIWPLLSREIDGISIDVIGANPPDELINLSRKDPRFRVLGFVDDVRPIIDQASIYVCPIRDGGGTKLKILDAFAMSKAMVAHPISCEGIEVTTGENVLSASSPEEYLSNLKLLIEQPDLRHQIGKAARKLVTEKYSFSVLGQQFSDILGTTESVA